MKPVEIITKPVATAKKVKEAYEKPTPKKWRKIGDAILGLGSIVTAATAVTGGNPYVIAAGSILTWLGKTLTNLTTE